MNTYKMLVENMFKVNAMEELELQQVELVSEESFNSTSTVITYKTSYQTQCIIAKNLPDFRFSYVEEEEEPDLCEEELDLCEETTLIDTLNSMVENTESELKTAVLESLIDKAEELESDEEVMSMVNDIVTNGCASGIVSDMIYTYDTENFFNTHSEEIFELLNESIAEGLIDANNLEFSKNNLAWWAYEVITTQILYELETAHEM